MESVSIGVVRARSFRSSDGFRVYGDDGAGEIDFGRAVSSRRVLLWPEASPFAGHLLCGCLTCFHLDAVSPDGHFEGTHLLDEHLCPATAVFFHTPSHVFGRFRYAVVVEDEAGNADLDQATVREAIVNSDPPAARRFVPALFEESIGRMTFGFMPSERLSG